MQKLYIIIPLIILFLGCFTVVNAQECSDFGEGDFMDLCVSATEAAPGSGAMPSNTLDIYDLTTGTAGTDGVADVQLTLEAIVVSPNANGTCDDGDFAIGACIGGGGALTTSSDFAATTSDDCPCTSGYICVTIDFLNGFSSTAAGFNLVQTSNNGSSEGYEASFGYVTAGTDATGAPLALPAVNLGSISTYCNAVYAAGTTISQYVGATGPGTYATDDLNAMVNNCATSGQNGEDTGSGTGAGQAVDANVASPNLGLNPTDIITQVKHIYFFSNAPGSDCDGDGDTGVGTNPSGSWSDVEFCGPPAPCLIENAIIEAACDPDNPDNAIVTVTFDEMNSSGTFNILDNTSAVVGTAMGTGTGIIGTFTITGPTTAAPGTVYTIQDGTDLTCMLDVMVDIPECMQPPCPDYTATISGGGQVCNNVPVDLFVTMSGGTGPYDVTLSDGTVITGYMSGDAIPVAPAMNTTYGVATVTDADGCPAMVAGSAEVMVIVSCANAGSLNGG